MLKESGFFFWLCLVFIIPTTFFLSPAFFQEDEILKETAKTQQETLFVSIVSPMESQKVKGSAIVIAVIEPREQITSAWFEVDGQRLGSLSIENNFSSDFNSLQFENGVHSFSITACIEENCQSKKANIEIINPLEEKPEEIPTASPLQPDTTLPETPIQTAIPTQAQDTLLETPAISPSHSGETPFPTPSLAPGTAKPIEPMQKTVFVKPSNFFSAATFYDSNENPVASGTELIEIALGSYALKISFFDSVFSKIEIDGAKIDSNTTLFEIDEEIDENSVPSPDKNFYFENIVAEKPGFSFEQGLISFAVPGEADTVFLCNNWDFAGKKCNSLFEKASEISGATALLSLENGARAFAFAKRIVLPELPPDFNIEDFNKDEPELKIKKSGKKFFALSKARSKFLANEMPVFELQITSELNEKVDSEIEAFLVMPDGTEKPISTEKIKRKEEGVFLITVPVLRSFKAGTYTLRIKAFDGNEFIEQSDSFEWGLIAVNTVKSTYKPGETVEFHVVVLDRESYGVQGAEVNLAVLTPSGQTQTISTINGTIKETTSSGIYVGELQVFEEGTHGVLAKAIAPNIDVEIKTTFEVQKFVPFEVLRRTATKIDPAVQPNKVAIEVKTFDGKKTADIREFVPKEFEIEGEGFSVSETESEKIIEWKNVKFNEEGIAEIYYYYSVPDKKPWLYNIGPLEINGKNFFFAETRAWMIAVDANPTTIFFFRQAADWAPSEPMPNASASGDSFLAGSTWTGLGMIDTAGSSTTTISTPSLSSGSNVFISLASFTSPPLVPQTISAANWRMTAYLHESATNDDLQGRYAIYVWDANDSKQQNIVVPTTLATEIGTSPTYKLLTAAGSAVTLTRGDKIVAEVAFYGVSPTTAVGTLSYNGNTAATRDSNLIAPASIRLAGDLNTGIVSPANNSQKTINTAFDVSVLGSCKNYSCGDTNVVLMYCINPSNGCSQWFDMNTSSSSPLYVSNGTYFRRDNLLDVSDTNYFVFQVTGTAAGTYTIRAKIDSNWSADVNYSSANNADINITISGPADYTFTLSLPSSGCTEGKGRISAGSGACEKGYFEPTDLSGLSDQTKVDPEGQTSSIPFFVYDNQSTGWNDINFSLHLNEALPSTLKLKVSKTYNGWASSCSGNTDVDCVEIDATPKNIGTAVYSTGSKDLNIFIFADFIGASVGSTDRNVTSTSGPS
ncbi:MAG: hypothetical protein QXK06_05350 [Candidatus Diapherotrites archaeon]